MQEIVIKIPEEIYKNKNYIDYFGCSSLTLADAIENGTVLPKGHGRLIDESQITGTFTWDNGYIECFAPTIIEADKAESEE
jgi:hypothetical protein